MNTEQKANRATSCLEWLVLFIIVVCVAGMLFPPVGKRPPSKQHEAKNALLDLIHALKVFAQEYDGVLPTGSEAEIMTTLRGQNPRSIVFFEANPKYINERGEFLDPWGTPYRIDLTDPANPRIHSLGPDKRDNQGAPDSDDIASWR